MADPLIVKSPSGRCETDTYSSAPDICTVLRVVLVTLAVVGALWLVSAIRTVLLLLVFSVLFAYLVAPLVPVVHRPLAARRPRRGREPPRAIAIRAAHLALFGAIS